MVLMSKHRPSPCAVHPVLQQHYDTASLCFKAAVDTSNIHCNTVSLKMTFVYQIDNCFGL